MANGFSNQFYDPNARNPFITTQQQPQQQQMGGMGGGMNPGALMQMFGQGGQGGGFAGMFGGGGAGAGAGTAGGGTAGATGGSAAGGGGSTLAAAGPWAALAAAIYANEREARRGGYRAEDDKQYAEDLLTGEVLSQDLEQRWLPKVFGEDMENDKLGIGGDMLAASQIASFDFGEGLSTFKDQGTIGKILDIF